MKTLTILMILLVAGCASPDECESCAWGDTPDSTGSNVGCGDTDDSVVDVLDSGGGSTSDTGQDADTIVGIEVGNDETAVDHTWKDSATGYEWSAGFGDKRMDSRHHAIKYCEGLTVNGKSDWELATIDELRTLVRRCPATMPGGECTATMSTWTSETCDGCVASQGTSGGWFSTSEVVKYAGVSIVISASVQTGTAEANTWAVYFHSGKLLPISSSNGAGYLCIR